MEFLFRDARPGDIPQLQALRYAVKENRLSDPSLVTGKDYEEYLFQRGRGWVCEYNNVIAGFAIVDLVQNNIWALFVDPGMEKKGIGKALQHRMLNWYFRQGKEQVWLGTAPGTRAEGFYHATGWTAKGLMKNGEMRFEMTREEWQKL